MEDLEFPFSFGRTESEKVLVTLLCLTLIGAVFASLYYYYTLTLSGRLEGEAIALYNDAKDAPVVGVYFGTLPRGAAWGETFWLISGLNETSIVVWNYTAVPSVIEVNVMYENTIENVWLPWPMNEPMEFGPYDELHIKIMMFANSAVGDFEVKIHFNQWEIRVTSF